MVDSLAVGPLMEIFNAVSGGTVSALFSFFIFIICLISIFTGRGFKFKIGKFIDIGIPSKYDNRISPTVISSIISKVTDKTSEKVRLEYRMIEKQISQSEDFILEFKSMFTDAYAKILSTKLADFGSVRSHRDYRSYQILVNTMFSECLRKTFRKSLIENSFVDMSTEKWEQYTIQKSDSIMLQMNDFLDIMYPSEMIVTRNEIDEENELNRQKYNSILRRIYDRAKDISICEKEKISVIDKELQEEIDKILNPKAV